MSRLGFTISLVVTLAFLTVGCVSLDVTRVEVQSFELKKAGVNKEKALDMATGILVDRGLDIKLTIDNH